jgi:tetratricopeptide (TPR) repeat protein
VAGAVAIAWFVAAPRRPVLTERDDILLADFVNTTGDPVFDGTLKRALAVELEQSPYLNTVSDARVQRTLKFMGRPVDERVTEATAREVCQREGIKAVLVGSIASLGSHYSLDLVASACGSGDAIARSHTEADAKEGVLKAVGAAASDLRKKLGESLASIQKFDKPIEEATTASLDALKAYTTADALVSKSDQDAAIPLFKRAIELDPNFALAYARLSTIESNFGDFAASAASSTRAYELKERVSERERLYIVQRYHLSVSGDMDRWKESLDLFARTYPSDPVPHVNLGSFAMSTGDFRTGVAEETRALELDDSSGIAYSNLAESYRALGRYDEANAAIERVRKKGIDAPYFHLVGYTLAVLQHDAPRMAKELAVLKTDDPWLFESAEISTAALAGRLREARAMIYEQADRLSGGSHAPDAQQGFIMLASLESAVGRRDAARDPAERALAPAGYGKIPAAVALAASGSPKAAAVVAESYDLPGEVTRKKWQLSIAAALLKLNAHDGQGAIDALKPAERWELGDMLGYDVTYLRGLAYLQLKRPAEAAANFQKIVDRPGIDWASACKPLARLGLARAAAIAGDAAQARRGYQDFLAEWKDADADLPVVVEARHELAALNGGSR